MRTIPTNELKLIKIGKTSIFQAEDQMFMASARVANDIINKTYPEVWVQEAISPDGKDFGKWLATPSRFN